MVQILALEHNRRKLSGGGSGRVLAKSPGLGDGARPAGVVGQQLAEFGLECRVSHSRMEFMLQLKQRGVQRLRDESAAEPVEVAARVRQ